MARSRGRWIVGMHGRCLITVMVGTHAMMLGPGTFVRSAPRLRFLSHPHLLFSVAQAPEPAASNPSQTSSTSPPAPVPPRRPPPPLLLPPSPCNPTPDELHDPVTAAAALLAIASCHGLFDLPSVGLPLPATSPWCSPAAGEHSRRQDWCRPSFAARPHARAQAVAASRATSTFEDPRDAEDAIAGRDGYNFDGHRLRVEAAHGGRGNTSSYNRSSGFGGDGGARRVSSDPQVSQSSSSSDSLVRYLSDIMDEYKDKIRNTCGYGPIAFMASVQSLQSLPQDLTSSGRFDFHIELPALAVPERKALLQHQLSEMNFADGDSSKAMHGFLPVAMRELRKYAPDDKDGGWEDVGGINEATLELPSKYPNIFTKAPVRLRSNILLYGPPGCGKTHIVRAAAAACSLRFISVKGPELLNKYIGSSEQSVRDFFAKAVAAAPCLLFFDEFDSIAPQRGAHSAGVSDRVVNQFLTELDGVETLTGVFVFAATSNPQLIDAALLRPGRFDRLVFCDFPRWDERLEILKVHSRTVSLASDASLEDVASLTEGFTGADLAAILTDAGLAAVHELLDNQENGVPEREPCISKELLMSVTRKARPSTPADEKKRYDREFGEFVSSRKSISTKVHLILIFKSSKVKP
ncbi:unnamed protein product [Miscanthus lutarioriparius]|uniref:AAA+ ATPase domain-containing protein n=1 Tax=Miscanthus lutarioriparius TaxID=422564 RepID=A0A811Q3T6_9POAL|nr:unnamed protein product [Miscanthus lutarioriparius]